MAFLTLTGLTALGSLLLQGIGLGLQSGENETARKAIARENEANRALTEKGQKMSYDLGLRQIRSNQREQARTWKFKEEERGFSRSREFADRFVSLMDRNPENARRITEVWRNAGQGR